MQAGGPGRNKRGRLLQDLRGCALARDESESNWTRPANQACRLETARSARDSREQHTARRSVSMGPPHDGRGTAAEQKKEDKAHRQRTGRMGNAALGWMGGQPRAGPELRTTRGCAGRPGGVDHRQPAAGGWGGMYPGRVETARRERTIVIIGGRRGRGQCLDRGG